MTTRRFLRRRNRREVNVKVALARQKRLPYGFLLDPSVDNIPLKSAVILPNTDTHVQANTRAVEEESTPANAATIDVQAGKPFDSGLLILTVGSDRRHVYSRVLLLLRRRRRRVLVVVVGDDVVIGRVVGNLQVDRFGLEQRGWLYDGGFAPLLHGRGHGDENGEVVFARRHQWRLSLLLLVSIVDEHLQFVDLPSDQFVFQIVDIQRAAELLEVDDRNGLVVGGRTRLLLRLVLQLLRRW